MTIKVIFAGTPDFAVPALTALIKSSYNVCAVYTQPDRPTGRGKKITASPIKQLALAHDIPVYQPKTLRDEAEQKKLADLKPDLMIVAAYGLILPQAVLDIPKQGCINVHASLLPRWRGAAPIQYAILAGDQETGITIMQMDAGMDTGNMLYKNTCPIKKNDTGSTLHDRLAALGSTTLMKTLDALLSNNITPISQDETLATYAPKIKKIEGAIDWQLPAIDIERKIRAFNPYPIAFSEFKNKALRIWEAHVVDFYENKMPGSIIHVDKNGICIATGDQALQITKLQLAGKKPLLVSDFLNAHADFFAIGNLFK